MQLPIHFAGAVLDRSRHVCAFFDDADQECRLMDPFVKEGLERGEKAFLREIPFFVTPDQFLSELRQRAANGPA